MKRFSLFVALTLFIGLLACSDKPSEDDQIGLGEQFTIAEGQTIEVPEAHIYVRFDTVAFDGRCPVDPDVYCFWEGMAGINLMVDYGPYAQIITPTILGFTTARDMARHTSVVAGSLKFTLRQLDPMPSVHAPPTDKHRAIIEVEEVGNQIGVYYPPVQIVDVPPAALHLAPFDLQDVSVSDNTLALRLGYGGGCEQHYIFAFMSPASFMESNPVQANIYLRHLDNQDACESYITDFQYFDLKPVAELYQMMYGTLDPIILNVHEYLGGDSTRVVSVEYSPAL